MIWDYNSLSMDESNVDEKECTIRFQIGTMVMPNIFKGVHRWILGQVMYINYTSFRCLLLAKQRCFAQSHLPIPPKLSHVAPCVGIILFMQRGMMLLQHKLYIYNNCGVRNMKRDVWVLGKKFRMWGHQG